MVVVYSGMKQHTSNVKNNNFSFMPTDWLKLYTTL